MSWGKTVRAWVRNSNHKAQGTATAFTKKGMPIAGNRKAIGEKARDKRMAEGLDALDAAMKGSKK